jgi:purine nucleoside phosphorylase
MTGDIKIGIIGGSGLYQLEGLEFIEEVNPETVSWITSTKKIVLIHKKSLGVFLVITLLSLAYQAETRLPFLHGTVADII